MIFENSSPKGTFGPHMSDSPNWSLTANSRSLQAAVVLSFKTTVSSRSHSSEKYDQSEDIRQAQANMVVIRLRLYRLSMWL